MEKSIFQTLNEINCNEHVEKKNGLTYLSWSWAWQIAKQNYPDAQYTIYENADGWNYHTDGRTAWVKTGVTISGLEHIEYLPVMDSRNRSIPVDAVTSFDVNKAIQRSLTKALARHGLGLYIYAGEDLPDAADDEARAEVKKARTKKAAPAQLTAAQYYQIVRAYAEGKFTSTGGDYRETWIINYNPSDEEIKKFDLDVQDYRAAKQDGVIQ
jgi:hypothetical protein